MSSPVFSGSTYTSKSYMWNSNQASKAGSTSTLISSITNNTNDAINYTYDDNGNIETISEGTTQKARYYYDSLNQLVRENNLYNNKTGDGSMS